MGSKIMFISKFVIVVLCFGLQIASCDRVRADGEKEERKKNKNPYYSKFEETAHLRPTRCQVCRLLSQEFLAKLQKTARKNTFVRSYNLDGENESRKTIDYETSEMRLVDILEGLCNRMKLYRARAGPEFPYIKGAMSHLREAVEDISSQSKVKLNFQAPEEIIEDHTHEMVRVKFKCVQMLEEYEEELSTWYFQYQHVDLLDWLCAQRVLKQADSKECLSASTDMPADYYAETANADKKPAIPMMNEQMLRKDAERWEL